MSGTEGGLCQYKDIFGKPNEGVHSFRVFGFAAVDIILTLLAAFIISKVYKGRSIAGIKLDFVNVTIALFLVGILLHWIFCVDTKLNRCLGLVR